MIGKEFRQVFENGHIEEIMVKIVVTTNKGYKTETTEIYRGRKKPKTKIMYFYKYDFEQFFWNEIKTKDDEKQ